MPCSAYFGFRRNPVGTQIHHSLFHGANLSTLACTSSNNRLNWCQLISRVRRSIFLRSVTVLWHLQSLWDTVVIWRGVKGIRLEDRIAHSMRFLFRWHLQIYNTVLIWHWHLGKDRLCTIQISSLLPADGARNFRCTVTHLLKEIVKTTVVLWWDTPCYQVENEVDTPCVHGTSQTQIWLILNKMTKLKKRTWALLPKLQVYASLSGCLTQNYFLFNLTLSSAWSTKCIFSNLSTPEV